MASRLLVNKVTTAVRPALLAHRQLVPSRAITSSSRLSHKESESQHPAPRVHEHKADSLKKQKEGKGHWKPELASDSEEAVKADRSGAHELGQSSFEHMQQRTKEAAEETRKAGTSMRDGL